MLIIPNRNEILFSNNNESDEFDFYKIIKAFFIANLLLSLYFSIIFLIISLNDKKKNKNKYLNIYEQSINELRNIDEKDFNQTNENEYKSFKNEFIKNLIYITYEGSWYNIDSIESNGLLYMQFSINRENFPDYLNVIIRLINGMYIDNWKVIYNEIPIRKLEIENITDKNKSIILKGEFDSNAELGKIFEKKKSIFYCKTIMYFIFPLFENNTINYNNNIIGNLNSTCKFFEDYKIIINKKEYGKESKTIKIYSTIVIIICLLMIINTNIVKYKLNQSEAFANGISSLTVFSNIIWNSYGCLCHFFLTVNYQNYLYEFIIPTITFFLNYSITDLKFMYCLWRLKNINNLTQLIIRQKLFKVYLTFYITIFFALIFVIKFLFYKHFIIIGILLTWTPQILYNIYYQNKIALPWSYIILTSIYRLFIPCYFRCYKNNFLLISPDYTLTFSLIILMIFQIYILFFQSKKGSRFFLPKKYRTKGFDFYKTREEIINLYPDLKNIECVICLNPLLIKEIDNSSNINLNNDFILNTDNENTQINKRNKQIEDKNIEDNDLNNNNSWKKKFNSFFEFSERSLNIEGKKYMITPCKHFFHSKCLELWLQRKRECPNCRAEIKFNI